jgi:hypothetical protein
MMSGRALAVSTALGVSVPKEYADFLEEYGIYERSEKCRPLRTLPRYSSYRVRGRSGMRGQ